MIMKHVCVTILLLLPLMVTSQKPLKDKNPLMKLPNKCFEESWYWISMRLDQQYANVFRQGSQECYMVTHKQIVCSWWQFICKFLQAGGLYKYEDQPSFSIAAEIFTTENGLKLAEIVIMFSIFLI